MLSPRPRALLVLLAVVAAGGAVAGCGQSELQKQAIEANDRIDTSEVAREAEAAKKVAEENAKLDQQDRNDRKGLAKDLVDAVNGTATQAQKDAAAKAKQASDDAKDAAASELAKAQAEVTKAQQAVKDNAENAQDDIAKALQEAIDATSPSSP